MFGLIPKDEKFFKLFKDMTENIIEGAKLLKEMLDNFDNPAESQRNIKELEHKGDAITHSIIKKLNTTFVTPLDREDIYELASKLEQGVEMIELSSRASNCLKVAGIRTIGELVRKSEDDLLAVKNFGQKSLDEIKEKLKEMGLDLGMKID